MMVNDTLMEINVYAKKCTSIFLQNVQILKNAQIENMQVFFCVTLSTNFLDSINL